MFELLLSSIRIVHSVSSWVVLRSTVAFAAFDEDLPAVARTVGVSEKKPFV